MGGSVGPSIGWGGAQQLRRLVPEGQSCSPSVLQGTRRPTLLDSSRLQDIPFISAEISAAEATRWATALDSAKGFEQIYSRFRDWSRRANTLAPLAQNPEHLVLREDSFTIIVKL